MDELGKKRHAPPPPLPLMETPWRPLEAQAEPEGRRHPGTAGSQWERGKPAPHKAWELKGDPQCRGPVPALITSQTTDGATGYKPGQSCIPKLSKSE